MSEQEFLAELEEILNVEEPLTMETKLDELDEWDSLAALMFQSFAFKYMKKTLQPAALKDAQTVKDLYAFFDK